MPKLTKRVVDAIAPAAAMALAWDSELRGFGVRVQPSGVKTFILQYRTRTGRTRRASLGRYGALTVDEARKLAQQQLAAVARGEDPAGAQQAARSAPTMSDLLDRYLDEYVDVHNAPSTQAEVRRLAEQRVRPALGTLKVAEVSREAVHKLHRAMRETPRAANLVLALLSKAFNLAEKWELRPDGSNPCRHVARYAEKHRERFLSAEELARLGATLREAETIGLPWVFDQAKAAKHRPKDPEPRSVLQPEIIAAIRLLLLTGARLGEILALRWIDVDLDAGTIMLPARKGGLRRPSPVGAAAMSLIEELPRVKGCPWLLPANGGPAPLSKSNLERGWRRVRHRAGLDAEPPDDVHLHDLRHTVGTIAGTGGANAFIVRDLLRHTNIAMTSRYVNHNTDPVRAVADDVSEQIASALASEPGGNVVPIRPRRRK